MKQQVFTVTAVLLAVAAVLFVKFQAAQGPATTPATSTPTGEQGSRATVLLFADPREAEESCGCAEVIRMVRDLQGVTGVTVREIDARRPGEEARRHGVRTSPAVLILDGAGNEESRFEGESPSAIAALREALDGLRRSSGQQPSVVPER